MARALIRMRKEMKTTIEKIRTGSGELYDAAQSMNKLASQTAESVEQVDEQSLKRTGSNLPGTGDTDGYRECYSVGNMVEETNN